jgi:putative pyoverdin transport system ATP-binding/permease protein
MNLILFMLRTSWKMVAFAIMTGFVSGGSSASLIAVISNAASRTPGSEMVAMALGFVALAIVALVTSIISQVVLVRLSQNAVFQLRMDLSRQILASELSHLEQLGNSRLLATLTEDVNAIANAVQFLPHLCINIAVVVGCLLYITWLSWLVFVMVIGLSVVAIGSSQWLLNRGDKYLALARDDQDVLYQCLRVITEGTKELKLNNRRRQAFLNQKLSSSADTYKQHNIAGLTLFSATTTWGKLVLFFAIGFVLFALPKILIITPATLSGYILTFTYIMMPMSDIVDDLPLFSRANIALDKIESLGLSLAKQSEISNQPQEINLDWQTLELREIKHTYQTDQDEMSFTLGEINLTFHSPEIVFIVGGNGSGKSTLAKLITGLYIPEEGEIFLAGERIHQENREWYRQHFSVIFSDFYLFDELWGLENSQLDIQEYLKLLKLDRKVKIENGKFSTISLSQGQKKRLALLTAYLEDRPIYLFDEWASDQDPIFKDVFYTKLLPELKKQGKTLLVISHDDRYFHVADRVIKLESGIIIHDS